MFLLLDHGPFGRVDLSLLPNISVLSKILTALGVANGSFDSFYIIGIFGGFATLVETAAIIVIYVIIVEVVVYKIFLGKILKIYHPSAGH